MIIKVNSKWTIKNITRFGILIRSFNLLLINFEIISTIPPTWVKTVKKQKEKTSHNILNVLFILVTIVDIIGVNILNK